MATAPSISEPHTANEWYLEYRTQFIMDALRMCGRDRFQSIVDFGCGDGQALRHLVDRAGPTSAIGVDLRAPEASSTETISFKAENFFDFEPESPCDLVTSIQVFEHIYEPWLPRYFEALQKSCRPGGAILISTPNRWRPSNILRAMMLRKPHMMNANPGVPPEEHLGHHRECSYSELAEIFGRYFPSDQWRVRIIRFSHATLGLGRASS